MHSITRLTFAKNLEITRIIEEQHIHCVQNDANLHYPGMKTHMKSIYHTYRVSQNSKLFHLDNLWVIQFYVNM